MRSDQLAKLFLSLNPLDFPCGSEDVRVTSYYNDYTFTPVSVFLRTLFVLLREVLT